MKVTTAKFIKSSSELSQCPKPNKPEYAFIGRSNVGKSSLINSITNQKSLAKTSQNPGKTQLINHFLINENWYLVDLPGYGYAKVSKTDREKWAVMIDAYLKYRENLHCVFVLVDVRVSPQKLDLDFLHRLGEAEIPFVIVFTKADKQKPEELETAVQDFENALKEDWEEIPEHFITSSVTSLGSEELLSFIHNINEESSLFVK